MAFFMRKHRIIYIKINSILLITYCFKYIIINFWIALKNNRSTCAAELIQVPWALFRPATNFLRIFVIPRLKASTVLAMPSPDDSSAM